MFFTKLCLATAFLAGALAAPLSSEKREAITNRDEVVADGTEYSVIAYSIGKREALSFLSLPADATVVDRREVTAADQSTYSVIAYSIGKEDDKKKREALLLPEEVYARVAEDAVARRGEAGADGAEYSVIVYSIGKRGEEGGEYNTLVYTMGKE